MRMKPGVYEKPSPNGVTSSANCVNGARNSSETPVSAVGLREPLIDVNDGRPKKRVQGCFWRKEIGNLPLTVVVHVESRPETGSGVHD